MYDTNYDILMFFVFFFLTDCGGERLAGLTKSIHFCTFIHSSDIYKIAHFCNVMFCIVILLLKYYKHFLKKECESIFVFKVYCVMGILS